MLVSLVAASACGGDSPAARMCHAAHDCGAIAEEDVAACIDQLSQVDAERAADECATCLETTTCGDITTGECATTCAPFVGGLTGSESGVPADKTPNQLTAEQLRTFCEYAVEQLGGENLSEQCTVSGQTVTVSSGTVAQCIADAPNAQCPGVTVGDYQDCYSQVGSLCDLYTLPACVSIAQACN